jgi:hypothetical protein
MLVVCILASALGALVMCLLVLRYGFMPILETNPARADRDLLVTRLGHAAAGVCFATSAILAVVYIARAPVQPAAATPDPSVIARLAVLERERQALGEEVAALREQVGAVGGNVQGMRAGLDQAESRVAGVEARLKRLGDDVAQASVRARLERAAVSRPALAPVREPVVRPPMRAPQRSLLAPEPERPSDSASPAAEPVAPGPMTHATPPGRMAASAAPKPAPASAPAEPQSPPAQKLGDKVRTDWDKIRRGFSTAGDEIMSAIRGFGRQ